MYIRITIGTQSSVTRHRGVPIYSINRLHDLTIENNLCDQVNEVTPSDAGSITFSVTGVKIYQRALTWLLQTRVLVFLLSKEHLLVQDTFLSLVKVMR